MQILPFILLVLVSNLSQAQKKAVNLKGVVIDASTNQPVYFATLTLYENQNILGGTSSDENGSFTLKITDRNATHIEISYLGYLSKTIRIDELPETNYVELKIKPSPTALEEIIIKNKKTVSQVKIDRKIINLGTDLQQSGTTALEAFEQIVDIQTDLSTGSITLRGSGNVRVLINGKPSPLNTTELLEQIPSASIDKIEIITSPSAKQQADGLSGIINIILKKNRAKGFNATINSSVGTRRYGLGSELNYNLNKFNLRLNTSHSNRQIKSKQTLFRSFEDGTRENILTPTAVDGYTKRLALGVDFFANDKNEFSIDFDYTDDPHDFNNPSFYTNVTGREDFIYKRKAFHSHITRNMNLNYRHKLNDEDFLEAEFNHTSNENRAGAEDFRNQIFVFEQVSDDKNSMNAFALDYSKNFSETIHFETGFLWNQRQLDSRFNIDLGDTLTNNSFEYLENIFAVYAMAKLKFGKLSSQAGLRFEHFNFESSTNTDEGVLNRVFSNFFPSIHFSYQINDDSTLNLGYSRRISRPDFRQLNPFQIGNPFFNFEGTPDLKPEFSDNVEISYQNEKENLNWSLTSFYRYRKDVIQRFDRVDENGVQIASYTNEGINEAYGLEGSLNYNIKDYWASSLSGNYYFTKINGFGLVTWDELYSSNIQIKNTFKINEQFSTDVTYRHMFKNQGAFRFIKPRDRIDFAFRARFIDNRLSINLRVVDVLDNNLMKRNTRIGEYIQNEIWEFQSQTRNYLINATYKLFKNSSLSRNRKNRVYDNNNSMN